MLQVFINSPDLWCTWGFKILSETSSWSKFGFNVHWLDWLVLAGVERMAFSTLHSFGTIFSLTAIYNTQTLAHPLIGADSKEHRGLGLPNLWSIGFIIRLSSQTCCYTELYQTNDKFLYIIYKFYSWTIIKC